MKQGEPNAGLVVKPLAEFDVVWLESMPLIIGHEMPNPGPKTSASTELRFETFKSPSFQKHKIYYFLLFPPSCTILPFLFLCVSFVVQFVLLLNL